MLSDPPDQRGHMGDNERRALTVQLPLGDIKSRVPAIHMAGRIARRNRPQHRQDDRLPVLTAAIA